MRFLVVDDDFVSRKKLEAILSSKGEVSTASGGEAGIRSFSESLKGGAPFDCVFIDIEMPGVDGLQMLKKVRQLELEAGRSPSKILMVTAHSDREVVTAAIQAGCSGYVVKPFQKDTILAKL